jgi:anti-sigma regulatory factor (Ser/Thr protein kinase)
VGVPPTAGSQTTIDAVAAWTHNALESLGRLAGVRRVGLALTEGGGRRLRFTASDRDNSERAAWCHVDAYDDVPLNTAVRAGQPVVGTLDDLEERYATFVSHQRSTSTVGLAAVPIVAAGQTVGGFVLFFDAPQAFGAEQRSELRRLGAELGATLREAQGRQEQKPASLPDRALPPGAVAVVHEVPGDAAGVGDARRFLRRALNGWGVDPEASATAVLCLSELVTNAVIHADSGCAVRAMLEDDVLSITVRDHGLPNPASGELVEEPLRVHGRGLQLVEALATRWGSEVDTVGTTVWFDLDLRPES